MKVTIEIKDCSNPVRPNIFVKSAWSDGNKAVLEVEGVQYTVIAEELISALKKVQLNTFGY